MELPKTHGVEIKAFLSIGGFMRWSTFSKLIMLEQTLFGLTWVLAAAILPFADAQFRNSFDWHLWQRCLLLLLAFTAARTAGMAFNRLIDRKLDAENPRTQSRVLPSGEASVGQVSVLALVASGLFLTSCFLLSTTLAMLSPLLLALIAGYSYTKRFTSLCHFVMGLISGLGPVCAWLAITDHLTLTPVLLGAAVWASIAAMDIIYALQDRAHDIVHGLKSIPACLGRRWSIWLARGLHCGTVLCLAAMGMSMGLTPLYYLGVAGVAVSLVGHHKMIPVHGDTLVYPTFFACNTQVGILVLIISVGAVLWDVMLSV